jgi:hypothetical protein
MKESAIQKSIVDFIRAVTPDCVCFAVPNAARRRKGGRASNGVPGLLRGVSDLIIVTQGQVIFAEVKNETGRASDAQRAFGEKMQGLGHAWCVWRSIDDVRRTFRVLDVPTRESV